MIDYGYDIFFIPAATYQRITGQAPELQDDELLILTGNDQIHLSELTIQDKTYAVRDIQRLSLIHIYTNTVTGVKAERYDGKQYTINAKKVIILSLIHI